MKGDDIGAGFGKIGDDAVDRLDHQVHIDRHCHMRANRLADQWADGQIGNIMVIHHVKVDNVGASADDVAYTSSPKRAKSADRMLGAMR